MSTKTGDDVLVAEFPDTGRAGYFMTQLTAHLPEPLRWDVFAVSAGHGPVSVWMRQRTPAEEARAERLAILYPCPTHQQVQMAVMNGNERQPN